MIIKSISTANGPASFHVLKKIEALPPFTALTLTIDSYANAAVYEAGGGFMMRHAVTMPSSCTTGSLVDDIEVWLISAATSPFQSGEIVADQSDTLDAARDRAWVAVKASRAAAEVGTFTYDGGTYDIDKGHVTGAVVLAMVAKSIGAPYIETWTLYDNSVRDLSADDVIALGVALGQRVSEIYAIARTLREQIDAAETIAAASAIHWPE